MNIITHRDTVNFINSGNTPIHKLFFTSKNLPPLLTIYGTNEIQDNENNPKKNTKIHVLDKTTVEALNYTHKRYPDSNIIFVNFANENTRGGKPGMRWNYSDCYVYPYGNRASAQEENIIEKSTAFLSLAKIKYPFNSEELCYVSPIEVFATDYTTKNSILLPNLIKCYMVISASINLSNEYIEEKKEKLTILNKIKKRICNQFVAADKINEINTKVSNQLNTESNNKKTVLILGAYGCGAFSPKKWGDSNNNYQFPEDIAILYKELINKQWSKSFDEIIFAVPTFGSINPNDKNYMNYMAFRNTFQFN